MTHKEDQLVVFSRPIINSDGMTIGHERKEGLLQSSDGKLAIVSSDGVTYANVPVEDIEYI